MAKDSVEYSVFIESKDRILSLFHASCTEKLNIIFPLFLNEGKRYVFVLNGKITSDELKNCMDRVGDMNNAMYFLQINMDYILNKYPLLLQIVSRQFLVACSDEEGVLFEKILKKLNQSQRKEKSQSIDCFYLGVFLQYLNEVLIRDQTFRFREEVLARNFYRMLQTESSPNHQVQYYAEKLFVSRRYLTKAVHNTLGQTPKSLITVRIIYEAKKLLSTRTTIYEIAEQLKFESSASFAVFFKKHTKSTPTEYRQKFLNT